MATVHNIDVALCQQDAAAHVIKSAKFRAYDVTRYNKLIMFKLKWFKVITNKEWVHW